ncbi:hypothetical protein N9R79_02305 [Vibrio sp.]|nr:hypothetical protein [Vibrio sp.]
MAITLSAAFLFLAIELPLVTYPYCWCFIYQCHHWGWFLETLSGEMTFLPGGKVIYRGTEYTVENIELRYVGMFIIVTLSGNRCLIWRDTLPENTYRILISELSRSDG